MLDLPLFRYLSLRGVGRLVVPVGIVVLAAPRLDRSGNVEICEFSQKRIKALLFVVPIDLRAKSHEKRAEVCPSLGHSRG